MKKCTYCGRENPDDATHCLGCFQDDRFESQTPGKDLQDELLTVTTCAKLVEADLIASMLESNDIETFIPDQHLMQAIGFNLNTYGYVRVQVRRKDYAKAKELLSEPGATLG